VSTARLSTPTVLLAIGTALEIFSGNWTYLHVPLGGDRILFAVGLVVLALGGARAVSDRQLLFRPLHLVLLATGTYATVSALAAQTFASSDARFALLDRLGLIPFLMFCLAPLVFGTARPRNFLLAVLVATGAYLGVVALLEGVGLTSLTIPSYIRNPNLGLHYGRARGPFLESAADGLSLYICGVAAAVGLKTWSTPRARALCVTVMGLSALGVVFTLTRAVWLGAVIGTLAAMMVTARGRRLLLPTIVAAAVVVVAVLVLIPGLEGKANSRLDDQQPIWDRYNTNAAAVRMVEARPLFGFGWQTFTTVGPDYMRIASNYPLTGAGNEVHNVFLSHAAELGIVGSLLWTCALFGAVGGAVVRRGPPELLPWRVGLVAIFVAFLVVASLGPLSYPFPNLLLWTWAGITAAEHFLRPRASDDSRVIGEEPEDNAVASSGAHDVVPG
jgi:O-antigen ligase